MHWFVFQLYSKIPIHSTKKALKTALQYMYSVWESRAYRFSSSCQENNAEKQTPHFQIIFGNNLEEKNAHLPVLTAGQVRQPLNHKSEFVFWKFSALGTPGSSLELSGKPPSMSPLFSFPVFPSETLVICIKPTCSL